MKKETESLQESVVSVTLLIAITGVFLVFPKGLVTQAA